MPRPYVILCLMALLTLPALLSACAGAPKPSATPAEIDVANDPLEPMNRSIFEDGYFLDRLLLRPLAELYRATIPPGIRDRIAGIVGNMKEPVIFANDVMQGEFGRASVTLERFGINTTIGVGGMWDIAGGWNLYQQTGDFGQTLASWGVGEGPYLMLPLLGPSNVRDAVGRGVDFLISPWQYVAFVEGGTNTLIDFEAASFGTDVLVRREQNIEKIDALRAGAIDPYAQIRSAWRQHRNAQLGLQPSEKPPEFEDGK